LRGGIVKTASQKWIFDGFIASALPAVSRSLANRLMAVVTKALGAFGLAGWGRVAAGGRIFATTNSRQSVAAPRTLLPFVSPKRVQVKRFERGRFVAKRSRFNKLLKCNRLRDEEIEEVCEELVRLIRSVKLGAL
jgi:hypothetical protein